MREAAGRAGRPVAILQDLPGPEAAHRRADDDTVELKAGDRVTLRVRQRRRAARRRAAHDDLLAPAWPDAIEPGEVLYLADGAVRLRVVAVRAGDGEIDAEVEIGGTRRLAPGPQHPGPADELPAVPEEDLEHLRAGRAIGVDLVALSLRAPRRGRPGRARAHARCR